MSRPSIDRFQSATDRARRQTEGHTKRLADQYATVIRRAGRRASRRFKTTARLAAFERLVAAGEKLPNWAVPPVDDLIDVVQVTQDLLGATEETRKAAATSAVRPITSTMGVSFSLEAPLVKDLTAQAGARAAKLSIPGLRDVVFAAIKQAFEEGLSVDQTAALIYDKADHLAGYQAEMLARTDLIGTANGGSLLAAKAVWPQGGVVKRWVNATNSNTVNDGRIRPTHLEANGQEVPIDGHFVVGGARMLYPGDPTGPDEEVVNCRCTIVYHDTVTATAWDESKHPRESAGRREGGRFRSTQPADAPTVDESRIMPWIRNDVEGLRSIVERDTPDETEQDRIIDEYEQHMIDRYHEEYDAGARTISERLAGMPAIVTATEPASAMALADPERHPGGRFLVALPDDRDASFTVFTEPDGSLSDWQDGVGDVLDPTDPDFFPADDTTGKVGRYVGMLRAVRGDVITGDTTLYRGMSGAERAAWESGDAIPAGKFFTSEPTANMAQDIAGEFPELHEFTVAKNDVVETDPGVYQLIRPATLKDGRIAAEHAALEETLAPAAYTAGEAADRARQAKAMRDTTEVDELNYSVLSALERVEAREELLEGYGAGWDETKHPRDPGGEDPAENMTADGEPNVSDKAMVAVYPRAEERDALGAALDPENLHVTLCYLGDAADVDLEAVRAALADIATAQVPLEGRVTGIGRFFPGEDGTPVFAIPSVKGLAELYGDVVEALAMYGIASPTEHGFNPHITLAYVEDPDAELPTVPDVPLHFDAITLTQGDVREDYALEG